jgi:Zn-dependent protease with chaperone function
MTAPVIPFWQRARELRAQAAAAKLGGDPAAARDLTDRARRYDAAWLSAMTARIEQDTAKLEALLTKVRT